MGQRAKPEPIVPNSFHLAHRYMEGLRFDGVWEYPVQTSTGQWRWKALLPEAASEKAARDDPQGVWWCVRQCAAVMAQQARSAAKLPRGRAPRPEAEQVAHALQALLPDCEIQTEEAFTDNSLDDLATVLEERGGVLLRLESEARACGSTSVRWAWMVGVETQVSIEGSSVSALLVVGPSWPAPWGSGFGSKVRPLEGGRWKLCSVDGEVMQGRVTAWIAVSGLPSSFLASGIHRRP